MDTSRADMTDITVVMATYKQAKYLEEAIDSILTQLGVHSVMYASVVFRDRDTRIAMEPLGVRYAGRIFKLFNDKPDMWKQRQRGLMASSFTDNICFFDSDDVMLPGWLERGLKVAEEISSRGKVPIVGPSYRMVDEKLFPIQDVILPEFSMDKMMNGCIIPDFSITTSEALRSVGGFFDPSGYDPGNPYYSYAMFLRLLKKYSDEIEVKLLPDIGFLYRQHKKAMHHKFALTKKRSRENVRRQQEIAKHYFPEGCK